MKAVLLLLASAVFGAADQYLGSFSAHPWAADVSLLSAPWLVLPFVVGCTQPTARRAAMMGLGCTFAALTGYCLMTFSPMENAHLDLAGIAGWVRSSRTVLAGGVVTGPLFGWLGQRWRANASWIAALITAGAVCLEPLATSAAGRAIRSGPVWMAEVAVGMAMAAYFTHRAVTSRGRLRDTRN